MKNMLLLLLLWTASDAMAVCSSPISRTNFTTLQVLTSTKLNTDINTAYTRVNELPGDCLLDESITSSKIDDGTIATADIADGAVTAAKLEASNHGISSSSGAFTTGTGSYADVTNLSVTITATGRPVEIFLVNGDTTNASYVGVSRASAGTTITANFKLLKNGSDFGVVTIERSGSSASQSLLVPSSNIKFFDVPAAGSHTYKLQASSTSASFVAYVNHAKLIVKEL